MLITITSTIAPLLLLLLQVSTVSFFAVVMITRTKARRGEDRIQPILVNTKIFCSTVVFSSIALKSIPPTTMMNSTLAMPMVVMMVKFPSSSAFLHSFGHVLIF